MFIIREEETTKQIQLEYCTTKDHIADIFTNALQRAKFEDLRTKIGIPKITSKRSVKGVAIFKIFSIMTRKSYSLETPSMINNL